MFFKLTNRNAYRDFVRNARRVALLKLSTQEQMKEYAQLYSLLSPRMLENETMLNSSPAFSKRVEHWNTRDVASIRPVTNVRNPWLAFKREFEASLNEVQELGSAVCAERISRSLAWFYDNPHRDDWIND
jgi:hypothetical protein